MPFYLTETDVHLQLADVKSALIVPCRFCPAASLAVTSNEPYFEFLHRGLKTASYERFVNRMKCSLVDRGIKTDVERQKDRL